MKNIKYNQWTDSKYFKYKILEDKTIEITGSKEDIPTDIIIPEIIEGMKVIAIGAEAFKEKI